MKPSDDRSDGGASVRAGVTRGLPRFLAGYPGLAAEKLLAAAGIDAAVLADPDTRLPARNLVALLEQVARETGDTGAGVAYAAHILWPDLGVLAHVALHSTTLGAALGNVCRYLAVQQDLGRGTLEVDGDEARVVYAVTDPGIGAHGQHTEALLALCTRLCRDGIGDETWAPRAVCFTHRAHRQTAAQARFFRAPLRWGEPRYALVLGAADLRRSFRTADAGLLPALMRHADECLAKLQGEGLLGAARRHVAEGLRAGEVTIDEVAARLGMSARSLQRRLQDDGGSFKALVAEVRLALSRRYVADPSLSLTEAAFLLGYSDLSAFSRAFRRWTGQSALDARRAGAAT